MKAGVPKHEWFCLPGEGGDGMYPEVLCLDLPPPAFTPQWAAKQTAVTPHQVIAFDDFPATLHRMKTFGLGRSLLQIMVILLLCAPSLTASEDGKSGVSAGQAAPKFPFGLSKDKTVNFPDHYKGKVVLLDFWATWCGPCRAELPNVRACYQKFHDKGFEVLGVSLDDREDGQKLRSFLMANKMTWPQIFDGKGWNADVAVKYGIKSIPRAVLVDGTTGIILVEGSGARGSNLAPAIEKALAAKAEK